MWSIGRSLLALICVLCSSRPVFAQTIPEMLARERQDLGRFIRIERGALPSMESVAGDTDLVVRGTVGEPRSYLSKDETEVYSDYPILSPVFFYPQSAVDAYERTEVNGVVEVTHIGGRVVINGYKFTMDHRELPPLTPGEEYVFLLKRKDDGKYRIAGTYYGVFRIEEHGLKPLTSSPGFVPELNGMTATSAIDSIVGTVRAAAR